MTAAGDATGGGGEAAITHELKAWPAFFDDILSGRKTFEARKDDRSPCFAVGDVLQLREWSAQGGYTGRMVIRAVSYVLRDAEPFGVAAGFCVMGLQPAAPRAGGARYLRMGKHDGDCTIYASLLNERPEDGICTCGYGRSAWVRGGIYTEMYSAEREAAMLTRDRLAAAESTLRRMGEEPK